MADLEKWKVVGERIGALIRLRGYKSVELFAYENDIDKSVLNRLIRGKREVRLSTFLKIIEALEVPLLELGVGTGLLVKEKEIGEARTKVLRLTRGEFDRIEVRKSTRDRNPQVSIAEQKKPPALIVQVKDVKIEL